MEADKVNRWLTLATNLAVVLGIGFLVIEVQQNTTAIRGQASIAVNDSLASLDRAIFTRTRNLQTFGFADASR